MKIIYDIKACYARTFISSELSIGISKQNAFIASTEIPLTYSKDALCTTWHFNLKFSIFIMKLVFSFSFCLFISVLLHYYRSCDGHFLVASLYLTSFVNPTSTYLSKMRS